MLQYLIGVAVKEIIGAIMKMVTDFFKLQKKKKEDKVTVKEALSEKDPQKRAANIRNLLS